MTAPCCIVCGIPFTPVHRTGGAESHWDPSIDTETAVCIDRERLGQGDVAWLKDVVVVGTRSLDGIIDNGLPEFYAAEAVSDSFSPQYNQILIRDPTYTPVDIANVNGQFRSVSLYSEFVPLHEACFEILDTVAERMNMPFSKDCEEADRDGVTEAFVDYFFKNMDIDGGEGLKEFDYGVDLTEVRSNRWEDSTKIDFVFADPLERSDFEDFLTYGPPIVRDPYSDSEYESSPIPESSPISSSSPSLSSSPEPSSSEPPSSSPNGYTSARKPVPWLRRPPRRQPPPPPPRIPTPLPEDHLTHLPAELLLLIASYLPVPAVLSLRATCKRAHSVFHFNTKAWRERCLQDYWFGGDVLKELVNHTEHTIDWAKLYRMLFTANFADSMELDAGLCWRNSVRIYRCAERIVEGVKALSVQKEAGRLEETFYQKPMRVLKRIQAEAAKEDGYVSTSRGQLRHVIRSDVGVRVTEDVRREIMPEISRVFRYATLLEPKNLEKSELGLREMHCCYYDRNPPRLLTYWDTDNFLCGIRFWGQENGGVGVGRAWGKPRVAVLSYKTHIRGFVVSFNCDAEELMSGTIGDGLVSNKTSEKFGIVGLKVLFDDGKCSQELGQYDMRLKQVVVKRMGCEVTGLSVHLAEDGRIVSLGMLEADTLKILRPGVSTYPPEGTGLDGKFWYPEVVPCSTLETKAQKYTVEPEFDDSRFGERAHLCDYIVWNVASEDDFAKVYGKLKEMVFFGMDVEVDGKVRTYVAGLEISVAGEKSTRIVFNGMVCEKVLGKFNLLEGEEIVNFHYLFEEDTSDPSSSPSNLKIGRYIDIVFKTSHFRTSPFLSPPSPGRTFTAFDNPPYKYIHASSIRGLAFDHTRNSLTPITIDTPSSGSMLKEPATPWSERLKLEAVDSTDNNPFRCAEGYIFCNIPSIRPPLGEDGHNIIISGFDGNLPPQYEGRKWLREAMASQTLFPFPKKNGTVFDLRHSEDMEIVAISYIESICPIDPATKATIVPTTGTCFRILRRGLRLLAFHFADGSAPRILSNDIHERGRAEYRKLPYTSPQQLLKDAITIPITQARLKTIKFRCVGIGAASYIDRLSICTSSQPDRAGGNLVASSRPEKLQEYQIYKHTPPPSVSSEAAEKPETKPKKMRIITEYRPLNLDDGREAGQSHRASSPDQDLDLYSRRLGTLEENYGNYDASYVEDTDLGMAREFVVECNEKFYDFAGLKALYPSPYSGQIVALAGVFRCTGEGAPMVSSSWTPGMWSLPADMGSSPRSEMDSDEDWGAFGGPSSGGGASGEAGGSGGSGANGSNIHSAAGGAGGAQDSGDNADGHDDNGDDAPPPPYEPASGNERSCLQELASRFSFGASGPLFGGSIGEPSTHRLVDRVETPQEDAQEEKKSWWF
ncbi:hypothetical protein BJ508DRAFT_418798 [Ascobolus immersus RN42]|uniref:F-box domain-containing protein n=1 Tax=Ascobolus immersus RN42 TaxID=1160509 RepID=A0A3N4HJM1_ASCIM|nr:hypothetical protein BJ508DRAFT_418798 [Ascobolus immersus RN42]